MFLVEEAGRHLRWEESSDEEDDTEFGGHIKWAEMLNAMCYIFGIAGFTMQIRVHCRLLRKVTNLK